MSDGASIVDQINKFLGLSASTDDFKAEAMKVLKDRALTGMTMCEGDESHDSHIDLYFGDKVLMIERTPNGLFYGLGHFKEEDAINAAPHDMHCAVETKQ